MREASPVVVTHDFDGLKNRLEFARSQEFGLLAAPGEEITLVKEALHGHWARVRRSAFSVYRSGFPSRFRHSRGNARRDDSPPAREPCRSCGGAGPG